MPITYLDFHFVKQSDEFSLTVFRRDSAQPLLSTRLRFPASLLNGFELRQLDFDDNDPLERVERLHTYGQRLYQTIFTSEIEKIWLEEKRASEFLVLCIRIQPEANQLETIPWETLFDGEEHVAAGAKTTVIRLPLDVAPQPILEPVQLPIKMLALVSSPLDLADNSRLQMEREQEILLEAINDPAGQGRLRVDFEDEAKLEVLESSLETPYQIFHFTGHGLSPEDGGGLLLEDVTGNSRDATVGEIIHSLRRLEGRLRLAVLSGCQTARTLNVGGFRDVARGLLRSGVPSVIAMQFSISDDGGVKFAELLYSRLASGRSLEQASHSARRALLLSDDAYLQADALAAVLLTANGECLQTTQATTPRPAAVPAIDFSFFLPLPQLSHGFYGRRREYRQIRDSLLHYNHRAVIVHGIGGIGKTALISHVATRLRKHFQGIYAFDCSSGTLTPEMVTIKLHQFFIPQGIQALESLLYQNLPADVLASYVAQILSQRSLLIILDNFETQLEHTDDGFRIADEDLRRFITTLVKATGTLTHFLFTTRYLFDLDEKRLGLIQALALEDLSRPEALSLMQKLPYLSRASYPQKLAALDRFGGHPYALVTLDRYCQHQSLEQALTAAKSIHAKLREFLAIEINYARLSERSRQLLKGLAAFRKAVRLEAAEWVLGTKVPPSLELVAKVRELASEMSADDAAFTELLNLLPERRETTDLAAPIDELVQWGLLTPIQTSENHQLSVHALVRDFCRDKQTPEMWRECLCEAAAFYINSTKLIEDEDKSQEVIWIEMEAFELLVEANEFERAAQLLTKTSELLHRWGFVRYLESLHYRIVDKLGKDSSVMVLLNLGKILYSRGEYDKSLECSHRALLIGRRLKETFMVAQSFHQIGLVHQARGEYIRALKCYNRSLRAWEKLDYPKGLSSSLNQIGVVYHLLGKYDAALEQYERVRKVSEQAGDRHGIATALHQIGIIHHHRGDHDKALQQYDLALKISEEIGSISGAASSLFQIGMVHYDRGDLHTALEFYELTLKLNEELGAPEKLANCLVQIGEALLELGLYEDAFVKTLAAFQTWTRLRSAKIMLASATLNKIRTKWGQDNFDAAWRNATGEEFAQFLTEARRAH